MTSIIVKKSNGTTTTQDIKERVFKEDSQVSIKKSCDITEKNTLELSLSPNEKCRLVINQSIKGLASVVIYSIGCSDMHGDLTHYIYEKSDGSFKIFIENKTEYERKIQVSYLLFF
jgi:hypothetical protein